MRGEGKEGCVEFYGSWFTAFPDAHVEVHRIHICDIAVEEGAFTGTHHGVLHTPTGDPPNRPRRQRGLHPGAALPRRQARLVQPDVRPAPDARAAGPDPRALTRREHAPGRPEPRGRSSAPVSRRHSASESECGSSAAALPTDQAHDPCAVASPDERHLASGLLGMIRDVPRISEFYGIVIGMYFADHPLPRFHARYGGDEATIVIATGDVLAGSIPARALRLVREWLAEHGAELEANWDRAREHDQPEPIAPLP